MCPSGPYGATSAASMRRAHPRVESAEYLRAVADAPGESLADMVRSFLDDGEVALVPEDRDAEHRRNTWSYSVEPNSIDVADVVAALHHVTQGLRDRFASHVGVATFYAWYDEQTGQLRCSVRSVAPESLPFGAAYRTVADAAEVVRLAAADSHPGTVRWSDLVEGADEPESHLDKQLDPFPVWAAIIKNPDTA